MNDPHDYCTGDFSPEDIVISGIAGRFPHCDNVGELQEALLTQRNLLEQNTERYEKGANNLPFSSSGTVQHIDTFDNYFFGIPPATAHSMDPMLRKILEVSYEAMVDSGYEPLCELAGANVGVYAAITNQDASELAEMKGEFKSQFAIGYLRTMFANRCSHIFDFKGPSYTVDSACSSSFVALCNAFSDMKEGRVDAALVISGQLCLNPSHTSCYFNVGMISPTATCDPFDVRANGIVRTEAFTALFLQKASVARRAYATVLGIKHACAGHVPEGIFVPSVKEQSKLFMDVLQQSGLSVDDFQYIEGHGTGTIVGDPIEVKAIDLAYCKGRSNKPLYLGSIKSNLGHPEGPAGVCGTIKAILAFESGVIAANYKFGMPNPNCDALITGDIQVVAEPMPLTSSYIPINCFGFGGSITHAILKKNPTEYPPSDVMRPALPRLILYPATTEAAVLSLFDYVKKHPELRNEFFALLNKLSFTPTARKLVRGYALFHTENPVVHVKKAKDNKRQVWFVMTGMGCQWPGMGLEMMQIDVFRKSMKRSAAVLKPFGIDLFEILKEDSKNLMTDRSVTPAFVSITAIQIALVDVLRALKIYPDGIIGHSTGELLCAYADGCCTAEQTILSAYWRGKSVESANLPAGAMAAVALTWEEAIRRCPKDVYPACHNAEDSVTISGLKEPVERFVAELQKDGIFARVVNAYGYAFHCEHVWPAANALKTSLENIFIKCKPRTDRWISTSYPEEEWQTDDCKMAGAAYFVHNLMSVVRFSNISKKIPSDAITIEIGPHFLLQAILKRSIGSDASYIGLMKRNNANNIEFFLESLGKLYVDGLNPKIEFLYPPVKFPVPRGTPVISDLIKWDHSETFTSHKWKAVSGSFIYKFKLQAKDSYLLDHSIDGRSLFPATGFVFLAWKALAHKLEKPFEEISSVIENFKIHRATFLTSATNPVISFNVDILDQTGTFEITEGSTLVASGKIHEEKNITFTKPSPILDKDSSTFVSGEEIYDELKICGYEYGPAFRKIVEVNLNGTEGFVEWKEWITFLDALLLFYMFTEDKLDFVLPTGALNFKIDPIMLKGCVEECRKKSLPGIPINFYADSKICRAVGVEITGLEVDAAPQHLKSGNCILEEYKFVPYVQKYANPNKEMRKYLTACNKVIEQLEKKWNLDLSLGKLKIDQDIDFDISSYIDDLEQNHKLLETLKTLEKFENLTDILQQRKDFFHTFIRDTGKDVSNTLLINEYCLRYVFDIMLENSFRKMSVLEISDGFVPVLPKIVEIVESSAMIKFKSKTLVCKNEDIDSGVINDCNIQLYSYNKLKTATNGKSHSVVISSVGIRTTEEAQKLVHLLSSTVENRGFILLFHKSFILPQETLIASLSNEIISVVSDEVLEKVYAAENLVIISKVTDNLGGNMYLLRPNVPIEHQKLITMSDDGKWFDLLKSSIGNASETVWLLSQDSPSSGLIGMVNCLRNEPGGDAVRCVFIPERSKVKHMPPFNLADPFYGEVLQKDLVMNVFKDGAWGSFRHNRLPKEIQSKEVDNSFLNIKKCGDLSTLQWMESPIKYFQKSDDTFVHIYYSALNFRDVMLATGKISKMIAKMGVSDDPMQNGILGLEFSGRNKNGQRVAGIGTCGGLATVSHLIPEFTFNVPDDWSLEDAATVPVVYGTCYYALLIRGQLRKGESILIHSGTGGIGLAAINIALSMNCEIFTTVGTEEKRQYLIKTFPQVNTENIGCSRNTTFEEMIKTRTDGRGVDVVLNSLADEKFLASIRCVAKHGRFVEIGKYDLALDHTIGLKMFLKNISFHGVFVDQLTDHSEHGNILLTEIFDLFKEGLRNGVVKPLKRTLFQRDEAEEAFRYMAGGTHIGKVLIKIRDEEKEKLHNPESLRLSAVPVTYFYSHKVYIVVGGLGGFGIEVCKWLLNKGAKNLVLTSRYGARTPYHLLCLKRWKKQGYNVTVLTRNVSIREEALKLMKEVTGPVGGIFNSAVVLKDAFLENMSYTSFKEVCAPKAQATIHLDKLSRCLCPELDHFVCFSSISCGRGNAGQMNYGYANSVMERVCELRRAAGLPGLAIQWGIIGEVGVVHRHMGDDAVIAGVMAQRVSSCLDMLDLSCQLQHPVVSSYVVKDSMRKKDDQNLLQQLAKIFGFKNASEFKTSRSFNELGLDSMIGVEIKQLLEMTLDINLTAAEIKELTIDDVKELLEKSESQKDLSQTLLVSTTCASLPKSVSHPREIEPLNGIVDGPPIFFLDLECEDLSQLRVLGEAIRSPAFALLWAKDTPASNVKSLASRYLKTIKGASRKECHLIALSASSCVAFEMVLQDLKSQKNIKTLTILNGSSILVNSTSKEIAERRTEIDVFLDLVENHIPSARNRLVEPLSNAPNLDQRVKIVVDLFTQSSAEAVDKTELSGTISSQVKKTLLFEDYTPKEKLPKDVLVIEDYLKLLANDVAEVKNELSKICSGKIAIERIPGMDGFSEDSVLKFISCLAI